MRTDSAAAAVQARLANETVVRTLQAQTSESCAPGVFVTFVSGTRYVPGALCLRSSMRRVQSRCQLKVVVDDLPGQELPDVDTTRLRLAYGRSNIIALSDLVAAVQKRFNASMGLWPRLRNGTFASGRFSDKQQQPLLGRRLLSTHGDVFASQYKAWAWALPWPKVVAVDSDMLVVANIDWMLAYQFRGPVAAVGACFHGAHDPLGAFNSGLMIFSPDIDRLPQMLGKLQRIHKRDKSCERRAGDQTLLNHLFQNRWHKLPSWLLTKVSHGKPLPSRTGSSALWHFVGEPKPWLPSYSGRGAWHLACEQEK